MLESLDECEGKNAQEYYHFLMTKYHSRTINSFRTYFPHLLYLGLIIKNDRILRMGEDGKKLNEYVKKFGFNYLKELVVKK